MPGDYQSRLAMMESWYEELVEADAREQLLLFDYAPHRAYLEAVAGEVIDIGGGAGIAARFLRPDRRYVVVDPSSIWRSPEWIEFGKSFRGAGPEPEFVAGTGEALPFADGQFDVALSFWSLNHVSDPRQCIAETARVLKPGGSARLVIDDIEPSWRDLLIDAAARLWARVARTHHDAAIKRKLVQAFALKMRGNWPVHDDHIRISEADLRAWMRNRLQVRKRQWLNGSLTFDLVRC